MSSKVIVAIAGSVLVASAGLFAYQAYTYRQELRKATAEIGALKAQVGEIETQKAGLASRVEVLDGQLKAVKAEAEVLNTQLGSTGESLATATGKVKELQERAAQISAELEATKVAAGALKVQNTQLAEALSRAESELGSARKMISGLQAQVAGLTEKLQAKEMELVQQADAHHKTVVTMTGQINELETKKVELQTAVVTTKAELNAFQSDPDTRLLGAAIREFRKSAVGRNDAGKAVGFLGGLFDYFGNKSMAEKEAREGNQGEPYFAIVFRDGTQQQIPTGEVEHWQARIDRIATLWSHQQAEAAAQTVRNAPAR
jgi:peptidoglycan hydrolase CwlO-like protein